MQQLARLIQGFVDLLRVIEENQIQRGVCSYYAMSMGRPIRIKSEKLSSCSKVLLILAYFLEGCDIFTKNIRLFFDFLWKLLMSYE